MNEKLDILGINCEESLNISFLDSKVPAGFPSPAQGYEDNRFDLNTLYIKHPAATVFMTVDTDRYKNI